MVVVSLLAELFWQMEFSENPAVTPELELAKLALVTSQDEEEEDAGRAGTDSSNDTDATLVDDAPPRAPAAGDSPPDARPTASPTPLSPGSVLGKRARDAGKGAEMDVDPTSPADYVMVSKPPSPAPAPGPSNAVASSSKLPVAEEGGDGDVEMLVPETAKPVVVKRKATAAATASDSVMMFGERSRSPGGCLSAEGRVVH